MRKTLLFLFVAFALFSGGGASATIYTVTAGTSSGNVFSPNSITTVVLGDTVRFVTGSGSHNVTSSSSTIPTGAATLAGGLPYDYIPTVVGTYGYWCGIHGTSMNGSFTVSCGAGPSAASVTTTGSASVCAPNAVPLSTSAQGGATYQWYNGTTLISGAITNSYNATASGSYSVKVSRCSTDVTSAPFTVTVNPKPIPLFTIPSGTNATKTFVNTTVDTAGMTWLWSFGDGQTSTAKNPPPHTYTTAGAKTVKLRATKTATTCTDSLSQTVTVTLGVANIGFGESFTIMPNPAATNITVRSSGVTPSLSLVDFSGRSINAPVTISGKDQRINIESIPNGIYLLRITTANGSAVEKITVMH